MLGIAHLEGITRRGWTITLFLLGACGSASQRVSRFVLERKPCFGICPSYRVEIGSDGRVRYEGFGYYNSMKSDPPPPVRRESSSISPTSFAALVSAFDRAWSPSRPNRYGYGQPTCPSPDTDNPTLVVVREQGARRDTLEVYYGCRGVPERIDRLGTFIDSVVGVRRWLGPFPFHDPPPTNDSLER